MGLYSGLSTFMIIWWLVLFMVLPWGVRRVDADELVPGEDPGAPAKPKLLLKFAATTVIAGVVFGLVYAVAESGVISFRV